MPAIDTGDFTLYDPVDPDKMFGWDASLITPGARRVYTVADMDGTMALLESPQIWTGLQTLTATTLAPTFLNVTDISSGFTGTLNLPGGGLFAARAWELPNASGVLALLSNIPSSYTFASLTAKPTTIAGYGITDFNSLGDARWSVLAHTHTFASLTSPPTTVAGYGITDLNSLGDARWGKLGSDNTWTGIQTIDTAIGGVGINFLAPSSGALFAWINPDLSGNDIVVIAPVSVAAWSEVRLPSAGGILVTEGAAATLANKTFSTVTMAQSANIALNSTAGTKIGTATGQKLAFHNSTAVIQRAGAAQAALATTAATTGSYGHTQAQADGIITLLNEIRAALVEKGLIKGAA